MKCSASDTAGAKTSILVSPFAVRLQCRVICQRQVCEHSSPHLADMMDVIVPPLLMPCHLLVARHGSHVEIPAQKPLVDWVATAATHRHLFQCRTVPPRDASISLPGVLAFTMPDWGDGHLRSVRRRNTLMQHDGCGQPKLPFRAGALFAVIVCTASWPSVCCGVGSGGGGGGGARTMLWRRRSLAAPPAQQAARLVT